MKTTSSKDYSKAFSGIIWQIKFDEPGNQIALEIRYEDSLDIKYYIIDVSDFNETEILLPKNINWWSSLSGLYKNILVINQYPNKNNPGPSTLITYNYKLDKITGEYHDFILDSIQGSQIEGHQIIDGISEPISISLSELDKNLNHSIAIPSFFGEGSNAYGTVYSYLETLNIKPTLGVEYYEINEIIIFSYYVHCGKIYERYLIVIKEGEINLHVRIDDNMKGLATESFITFQKYLIFVTNRKILHVHAL